MRILANAEVLAPTTGIGVQILQVTAELARRGHQVDLVYLHDGPLTPRYAEFCHTMRQVPALDLGVHHLARDAPRLVPALRTGSQARPDVVYVNRYRSLPWALGTAAMARTRAVCHVHGMIGLEHPPVNRVLTRLADRTLCVSSYVRDRFVELGGRSDRCEVVHNGIDPAAYPFGGVAERRAARESLGLPADVRLVLYFGRIDPTKGVDVLVRALAARGPDAPPVELLVVGSTYDDAWTTSVLDTATVPVHRLDMRTDVVTPLHAADLVAVPSVWDEPFGRTVIEALATGRPVIGSAVGGIPEILTGRLARFLVPPDDAPALAAAIDAHLDWRRDEPDLGTVCRDHVTDRFTLSTMVDAVEASLSAAAR